MFKSLLLANDCGGTERIRIEGVVLNPDNYGRLCALNVCYTSIGFSEEEYVYEEDFDTFFNKYTLYGDPHELIDREFEVDYDVVREENADTYAVIDYVKEIGGNIYADALIFDPKIENIEDDVYNITGTLIKRDADGPYRTTSEVINVKATLPDGILPDDLGNYFGVTRVEIDNEGTVVNYGNVTIANSDSISDVYICNIFEVTKQNQGYTIAVQLYRENQYGYLSEIDSVFEYEMSGSEYRNFTASLADGIDTDTYYLIEGLVILNKNGDIFVRFDRLIGIDFPDNG